jgi:hypothetical protein
MRTIQLLAHPLSTPPAGEQVRRQSGEAHARANATNTTGSHKGMQKVQSAVKHHEQHSTIHPPTQTPVTQTAPKLNRRETEPSQTHRSSPQWHH